MEKVEFERLVEVPPIYLNSRLRENIKELIKALNICNKKDGYISEICTIKNIESVGISKHTNFPIIRVEFTAITILPEVGKSYNCKILQIYSYAMVLEYNGPVKIIVPEAFFKEKYIYQDSKLISLTDGGLILDKGDMIDLVLKDVKYSKGFFNCIATILDKDLVAVNPIKKI
jgi:DNA-directed RNA polymerase subunit E'/Rpb7